MGLVMVYTCGVLIVIVSFRICRVLQAYHREIYFCGRKLFLKHLALPVVLARRQCVGPITRLQLFSQSAYWLTTLVFNVARSKGLPDAASRAASLALLHVIMLVGMGRMSLFADLLCLPLRSYWKIYRSVGWMTVVQSTIHLSIRVYLQGGGLADPTLRYGLVVGMGALGCPESALKLLPGLSRHALSRNEPVGHAEWCDVGVDGAVAVPDHNCRRRSAMASCSQKECMRLVLQPGLFASDVDSGRTGHDYLRRPPSAAKRWPQESHHRNIYGQRWQLGHRASAPPDPTALECAPRAVCVSDDVRDQSLVGLAGSSVRGGLVAGSRRAVRERRL